MPKRSLRNQILGLLLLIWLPLLLFLYAALDYSTRQTEEKIIVSSEQQLHMRAQYVNAQLCNIRSAAAYLDISPAFIHALEEYPALEDAASQAAFARNFPVHEYELICNELSNTRPLTLTVILPDGRIVNTNAYFQDLPTLSLEHTEWFSQIKTNFSSIWIQNPILDFIINTSVPQIHCVRQVSNGSGQPLGVVVLSIPSTELQKFYASADVHQNIYILDKNYSVVSCLDNHIFQEDLYPIFRQISQRASGSETAALDGQKIFIAYDTVVEAAWRIITLSDYSQAVALESPLRKNLGIIAAYCLLAAALLFCSLSRALFAPLSQLVSCMKAVQAGNLSVQIPIHADNEIGDISRCFNHMTSELSSSIDRIARERALKQVSELRSFESQINPHFIYNTLASIRYLVLSGSTASADTAILSLIRFLQSMLSTKTPYVTLSTECAHLSNYVDIEQLIFNHALQYTCSVDEQVSDCLIGHFLLQPLLENAILHGLKPKPSDWRLSVTAVSVSESELEVRVQDNGVGFDVKNMSGLLDSRSPRHVGISNVRKRVQLIYGPGYDVVFDSQIGAGTTCILRLPKILCTKELPDEHFIS